MTAPDTPSCWSPSNPYLQTAVDSTSLNAMLFCPRHYFYTILKGYRKSSVDLDFGGFIASGLETFWKVRLDGGNKTRATVYALRHVLELTYNEEDGSQWGGYWEEEWKCAGDQPYKNAKGNAAKCPYAHKKIWMPGDAPDVCGSCGGSIITQKNYNPDHKQKHRVNLARAIIWYAEDQPEVLEDGLHPIRFEDGTPAIELSWRLPLPWTSPYDDDYILCGHFDMIAQMGDEIGVVDAKTTKNNLGKFYFDGYSVDTQFDTYDMAAPILFPDIDFEWIGIDAIQLLVDTVRTARFRFSKTEEQRAEHMGTIRFAIDMMEKFADEAVTLETAQLDPTPAYPMNKRNCTICPFKQVCSRPPEDRQRILDTEFSVRHWNPLANR